MEVKTEAIIFDDEIHTFLIGVSAEKREIVVKRLQYEKDKINDYLKKLKSEGLIKSIYRPKNKQMKAELKALVLAKKKIEASIKKLNTILR